MLVEMRQVALFSCNHPQTRNHRAAAFARVCGCPPKAVYAVRSLFHLAALSSRAIYSIWQPRAPHCISLFAEANLFGSRTDRRSARADRVAVRSGEGAELRPLMTDGRTTGLLSGFARDSIHLK